MNAADRSLAIEVRHFSFALGTKPILHDIGFAVRRGQYAAIVGPNGAGKTTLLKCLDRIYRGGTGQIAVFGRPLETYSQRELAKRISYVPQADGRVFPFTVEQFVLMGRYPHLSPFTSVRRHDRQLVWDILERTGTAGFAQRRLDTLSGGERQKVYIAAALAQEADVLLLDEPTTFLDYRHQAEIRALLAESRRRGATILAVTHDVNAAAVESDWVLALRQGRLVFSGTPRELMQPQVLEQIYATRLHLVPHPTAGLPVVVPHTAGGVP